MGTTKPNRQKNRNPRNTNQNSNTKLCNRHKHTQPKPKNTRNNVQHNVMPTTNRLPTIHLYNPRLAKQQQSSINKHSRNTNTKRQKRTKQQIQMHLLARKPQKNKHTQQTGIKMRNRKTIFEEFAETKHEEAEINAKLLEIEFELNKKNNELFFAKKNKIRKKILQKTNELEKEELEIRKKLLFIMAKTETIYYEWELCCE